ncbi:hypothetical protein FSARC_6893 [Fusarium sarcochroum]|uniref:Protein kinase domain-containing protein n=1 Tax=Fusarium sarcochroum TaxID=1208366 RepID=A0A8H4TWI4_9HYPO|nr:hypothetical protein FSARC_6893 [Fusarium sarcochroum]
MPKSSKRDDIKKVTKPKSSDDIKEVTKPKSIGRNDIKDNLVGEPETVYKRFLPIKVADELAQKDNVELTLTSSGRFEENEIPDLAEYIMNKAKRVFLILVYCEAVKPKRIKAFKESGLTDQDLPLCRCAKGGGNVHRCSIDGVHGQDQENLQHCFRGWRDGKIDGFLLDQWIFLAPVFKSKPFSYLFHPNCPLPYSPLPSRGDTGRFSAVDSFGFHVDHITVRKNLNIVNGKYIEIAVKHLNNHDNTDMDKFYEKEKDTLEIMRTLNHDHLIRAIACYKKGKDNCFVLPWARGGNLRYFWKDDKSTLNRTLVTWFFKQVEGISDGIMKLSKEKIRHGDLKPENILHFPGENNTHGLLKVADVGVSKLHPEYTRDRLSATTNRYGSSTYLPPEVFSSPDSDDLILSRKYDTWGLGCIFLEFVIWLVYGQSLLGKFHKSLQDTDVTRFWKKDSKENLQKHPAVQYWVHEMLKKDLGTRSALQDLVNLIDRKLLVVSVDERVYADELVQCLDVIRKKYLRTPSYLFNQKIKGLVDPTARASAAEEDNDFAQRANQLPVFNIGRDMDGLEIGSRDCPLCRFLFRCLSKLNFKPEGPLRLTWDNTTHAFKCSNNVPALFSIYLDPYNSHNTPYARYGLPQLPEMGSLQQFKLLNEWVHRCDETHDCISRDEIALPPTWMPTRVIYVGTSENPSLYLIETSEISRGAYVALSHRWGDLKGEQRFCAYVNNLQHLKKSIPEVRLPKTFRDAVRVTRGLGITYLWIDSLCIIQDNATDWEIEAGKMEDVYSSAYCTLAASSAASSLDGFLGPRAERACFAMQTSQGPLYLAEAIDDFQTDVQNSILNTRGWVLQERALSRRTIHFTSTQVYWECGEGVVCETLAQLQNPQSQFLGDSQFPNYGLQHYKGERIRLVQYLYQLYSSLNLTNAIDRSRAILGLQKRLGRTFESEARFGVLWAYFERTLLWQAEHSGSLSRIPYGRDSTVPSWSWMAYTGRIQYMAIPFDHVDWVASLRDSFSRASFDTKRKGAVSVEASKLFMDRSEVPQRFVLDSAEHAYEADSWKCVVIGTSKVVEGDDGVLHYVLLIRPITSMFDPTYERTGVGILLAKHFSSSTSLVDLE